MVNRFNITRHPIFLLIFISLLVNSCNKIPTADFTYEPPDGLVIGDTVYFINESIDADSYEWDFGNGETSSDESPFVIYQDADFYTVVLQALSKGGSDTIQHVVDVNYPTALAFRVYYPDSTTLMDSCNVWVYDNEEDYKNFAEPQFSDLTDENGEVLFDYLEGISYYVILFKETSDGVYLLSGHTSPLELYLINGIAVIMEFTPNSNLKSLKFNTSKLSGSKVFVPTY